jgi:hypothetical protein
VNSLLLYLQAQAFPPSAVLASYKFDAMLTGVISQEYTLNTGNVNTASFGLLGKYSVTGEVYAQVGKFPC